MIKIEHTEVVGWEAAIRGMRNPLESWDKSDSFYVNGDCCFGDKDEALMVKLANAGSDHRKYMRMIIVTFDITAPMYFWKELDTYKVGTVRNSCSTMHKLGTRELDLSDFSHEKLDDVGIKILEGTINAINNYRNRWVELKAGGYADYAKKEWYKMIQLLPSTYNQRSTMLMNYEVLRNIYHSRKNHKLDEWHEFCRWIGNLPMSELITGKTGGVVNG